VKRILPSLLACALTLSAAIAKVDIPPPPADKLPELSASLASRLSAKTLDAPDGTKVAVGSILDAARAEVCLRTIGHAQGWPASWLVVSDKTLPYDLVVRVALSEDGTIAEPGTLFLAARSAWDDDAYRKATGAKPPRERSRSLVIQSFTKRIATRYVYDLPPTGTGAKGLLAFLPEGSLIREADGIDLRDGLHHTLAIVLLRPAFVPADCATEEGRALGHRDDGGILLVLAGERALEDSLDITEIVRGAPGGALLPRFACDPGDVEPGAIDRLVDAKFEGREAIRLIRLDATKAQTRLDSLPVEVGVTRREGAFRVFARPVGR
jgi:hypothetical protein